MTRRLFVLASLAGAVAAAGCSFDAGLAEGARIVCLDDADCPSSYVCVRGLCRTNTELLGNVCGDGILATDGSEECDDGPDNGDDPGQCRPDCTKPTCGDGVVDPDEACDDGNAVETDACTNRCTAARCGDGVTQASVEECDLGPANSDTGACTTACTLAGCGDGFRQAGEQCDDGNQDPADGCAPDCQLERCGNDVPDPGEACDDGNNVSGDGCSADCLSDETCGNGYVDAAKGERCDDGDDNSSLPDAPCRPDCTVRRCGDGVTDTGEACDDGDNLSGDGCSADCQSDETCGNGVVDFLAGEQCDDHNTEDGDGCDHECLLPHCGDGVVMGGEQCDGSDNPFTCDDFGYYAGVVGCTPQCTLDLTGCSGRCGDGVVQRSQGELCDGAPPASESCVGYGFDAGVLTCSSLCGPALRSCETFGWEVVVDQVGPVDADGNARAVIGVRTLPTPTAFGEWDGMPFTHTGSYRLALAADSWVGAAGDTTLSRFDGVSWTDVAMPGPPTSIAATPAGHVYSVRDDCSVDVLTDAWASLPAVPDRACRWILVVTDDELYVSTENDDDLWTGTLWQWDGDLWTQLPIRDTGDRVTGIAKRHQGLLLSTWNGLEQVEGQLILSYKTSWGVAAHGYTGFGAADDVHPYFLVGTEAVDLPWVTGDRATGYVDGAKTSVSGDLLGWGAGLYRLHSSWVVTTVPSYAVATSVAVGEDGRVWGCSGEVYRLLPETGLQSLGFSGWGGCRKVVGTPDGVRVAADNGIWSWGGSGWTQIGWDNDAYDVWHDDSTGVTYGLTTSSDYPTGVVASDGGDLIDLGAPPCPWLTIGGRPGEVYLAGDCSPGVVYYNEGTWEGLPDAPGLLRGMYVAPDGQVFGADGYATFRFDGTTWSTISGYEGVLVAGASANDVWFSIVTGFVIDPGSEQIFWDGKDHGFDVLRHWDGSTMSSVRLPVGGGERYSLAASPGAVVVGHPDRLDLLLRVE